MTYTIEQAADKLGTSAPTVRKHAKRVNVDRIGRTFVIDDGALAAIAQAIAAAKPGRPRK